MDESLSPAALLDSDEEAPLPIYKELVKVTLQLGIAQLAPFLLAFAVHRAALKAGATAYEGFSITDRFNLTFMIAAAGFLQSLYFVAGRELAHADDRRYHGTLRAGLFASLALSLVLAALSFFASRILSVLGVEPSLLPIVSQVGAVAALGIAPALLLTFLRVHFVLRGRAVLMTVLYILGSLAGVGMVQFLATPSSETTSVVTIAWAVVMANVVMLLLALAFERSVPGLRIRWNERTDSKGHIKNVWRIGWPIGCVVLLEDFALLLSALLLGLWWHSALSAHSIVLLWLAIVQVVPLGLSQIATRQIAMLHAQNRMAARNSTAKAVLILGGFVSLATAFIFAAKPLALGELFTGALQPESPLAQDFTSLFPLAGLLSAAQTFILLGASLMRGIGETRAPLLQAFVGYGLLAGLTQVLFAKGFALGPTGVWWGMVFGFSCTAFAMLLKVRSLFFSGLKET